MPGVHVSEYTLISVKENIPNHHELKKKLFLTTMWQDWDGEEEK